MVQVLKRTNRSPLEALMGGIGENIGPAIQQHFMHKQQNEQLQKQRQQLSQLTGFDLSEFSPEMLQEVAKQHFQQQGKQAIQNQKQDFVSKIFGGNQQMGQSPDQMLQGQPQMNQKQMGGFDPSQISDEAIIAAENMGIKGLRESKNAKLKKIEDERKAKQTQFQADREYHSKVSQPIIDEAHNIAKQAPIKKGLIAQQRRDIASGNTSGILPFLVEVTGLEAYRNPESARFKTASKQRFVETLHELGGSNTRPNQFIEQQLVSAQPTLGRNIESNETVLDLEDFVEDMKLQRANLELQLAEEDREKYGFARNDIAMRADKMMADYAEKRQDEMAYSIRQRHEANLSDEDLINEVLGKKVPQDTPLTLRTARILMIKNNQDERKAQAEAKKLGFRMPLESTYKR